MPVAGKSSSPYGQPFSGGRNAPADGAPGFSLLAALAGAGILLLAVTIFVNAGVQDAIGGIDHPIAQWFYHAVTAAESGAHRWYTDLADDETRARSFFIWVGWVFISIFIIVVLKWMTGARR